MRCGWAASGKDGRLRGGSADQRRATGEGPSRGLRDALADGPVRESRVRGGALRRLALCSMMDEMEIAVSRRV